MKEVPNGTAIMITSFHAPQFANHRYLGVGAIFLFSSGAPARLCVMNAFMYHARWILVDNQGLLNLLDVCLIFFKLGVAVVSLGWSAPMVLSDILEPILVPLTLQKIVLIPAAGLHRL
ncbi:hypothetical protein B0H11DRAFT_2425850 [Mycena galericulata]|nr:hypothetical protein B0H11DRAFT_2425850 [Mycena galericulata]